MIDIAYAAVTASAVNGPQTLKSSINVLGVNRLASGHYACHFREPMPATVYTVCVATNEGGITHKHIGYNRVSRHRCDVWIVDNNSPANGLDIDFTIRTEGV